MTEWHRLAAVDDLPAGTGRELTAAGRVVALFNVAGKFYAMDGICPHAGGPVGQGTLDGCIVTCPWHGWQFDVTSGQHSLNPNLQHTVFPVKVVGEDVFVELD